ncbi:GNAT family N-acetyltransferase [Larkinella soli]|uniref:GNAT family N-acetyltransferase n=1 Tax=Larkinella soli TaxID=1770527 RepID=UPI000FFB8FAC|nr:GNAT family N-acetyltransferase [Larkinella soli]
MNRIPIPFRSATRSDLPFVAWCNYEATSPYPGFSYWDPLLDGFHTDTHEFIQTVLAHDALAWGRVEDFVVGELDNQPVCGASGFVMAPEDYRPLRLDRLAVVAQTLGWSTEQLALFEERYRQVWSDPHDPTLKPTGEWTIECVAVQADYRHRGLGKQLLEAVIDLGRAQGYRTAGIAVTLGNEGAHALYRSVGFDPYLTYWPAYFHGQYPGTQKFIKTL